MQRPRPHTAERSSLNARSHYHSAKCEFTLKAIGRLLAIAKWTANRGLVALDLDAHAFRIFIESVKVFPITMEIARQSTQLDFTSDPADETIAATSIVEEIPLMTGASGGPKWFLSPFSWQPRLSCASVFSALNTFLALHAPGPTSSHASRAQIVYALRSTSVSSECGAS